MLRQVVPWALPQTSQSLVTGPRGCLLSVAALCPQGDGLSGSSAQEVPGQQLWLLVSEMHVSFRGNGRQMPSPRPTWLSSGMLYTSESSSMVQALNGTAWFAMVLAARQWTRRISCSQETISFS